MTLGQCFFAILIASFDVFRLAGGGTCTLAFDTDEFICFVFLSTSVAE